MKKIDKRLIFALEYCRTHGSLSPSVLAKAWDIELDTAIDICSRNFSYTVCDLGVEQGKTTFDEIEKKNFDKLLTLK